VQHQSALPRAFKKNRLQLNGIALYDTKISCERQILVSELVRPSFGDRVRIRRTPVTEAAGLADLEGNIYGESVPSTSGVEVVGPAPDDLVLNVYVEPRGASYWLAPEHIELLHHNPGMDIRLDGVPKRWVRRADGGWDEVPDEPSASAPSGRLRAWWKGLFGR
jgi:hypothetical protein